MTRHENEYMKFCAENNCDPKTGECNDDPVVDEEYVQGCTLRNCVVTCYGDDEINHDSIDDTIFNRFGANLRYGVINFEKTQAGLKHLQCYFEFKKSIRFKTIHDGLGTKKCKIFKRKGTAEQASAYCMKEESQYRTHIEFGTMAKATNGHADDESIIKWIADNPLATYKEYIQNFENRYIRYSNSFDKVWARFRVNPKGFAHDSLLPIQVEIIERLKAQNDRQITWIYDLEGGIGKSAVADYLDDQGDTFLCSVGKWCDIFHAFSKRDGVANVVIDLTRQVGMNSKKLDFIYGIAEAFKDGKAFSGKYDSSGLRFNKQKVLILSNTRPDPTKWSQDRYDTLIVQEGTLVSYRGGGNTVSPLDGPECHDFVSSDSE